VYGRQPVRIAAFDLGSNSFHLLVADAHPDESSLNVKCGFWLAGARVTVPWPSVGRGCLGWELGPGVT
jgi:hypothetical protein